MLVFEMC